MNGTLLHDGPTIDHGDTTPSAIVVPVDGRADLATGALTVGERWAETFGVDMLVVTAPARALLTDLVVEAVSANPSSAVCVGTDGRSPLVDVAHDDIAQQILRSVDVPVLLVGPHCSAEELDGPVVVAHDGSSKEHAVLGPARVWAEARGAAPVLLHVHPPLGVSVVVELSTLHAARLELGEGAALEVVPSTFPSGVLREYAREVDASLLAMSTCGRTGTLTASTGRTASWVVRESPCPVLVAHPS